MDKSKCLFCDIVQGKLPSTNIYSDDQCIAFNDINPVANVHVLVIPREHVTYLTETTKQHEKCPQAAGPHMLGWFPIGAPVPQVPFILGFVIK